MRTTLFANALRAAAVILAVLTATVLTATSSASAQTPDTGDRSLPGRTIPLAERAIQPPALPMWDTAARQEELDAWIEDFSQWQAWAATWGNRREPGWFRSARARRPKPDPPLWLFQACEGVALDPDAPNEPCQLLSEWSGGAAAATQPILNRTATDRLRRHGEDHLVGACAPGWRMARHAIRCQHLRRAWHARDNDGQRAISDLCRAWRHADERANRGWQPRMENRHQLRHRVSALCSSLCPAPRVSRIST